MLETPRKHVAPAGQSPRPPRPAVGSESWADRALELVDRAEQERTPWKQTNVACQISLIQFKILCQISLIALFLGFLTTMKFHRHFQMVASFGGHNFRNLTVINTTITLMSFFSLALLLCSLCWSAHRQVLCCLLLDSVFTNNWEQWVSRSMVLPLWTWKGRRSACQSTKEKWCWLKMWPPSEVPLSGITPRYVIINK